MNVRLVKEKAARLVSSGQYERAEVLLRQALTQSPNDVQTWLKHAEVLKRLARNDDAISSYRIAARILDETGHHPRAVAALKLGLALSHDDIDLVTDIIRLEMRARRSSAGVRALFPVSSPSKLLGDLPASSDSSLYSASSSSMLTSDENVPQLALPMTTTVSTGPAEESSAALEASAHGDRAHEEPAPTEPEPQRTEAVNAAETEAGDGAAPSAPVELELEVEVEDAPPWPQVRRLSDTRIAVQAVEGARWVVLESTAAVSVRFEDTLEIPDDAEWLE